MNKLTLSQHVVMAVPTKDKSLAGGVINTAFQIGSGCVNLLWLFYIYIYIYASPR